MGTVWYIKDIVDFIIPIAFIVTFGLFLFGLLRFFIKHGDAHARAQAKRYMQFGAIGFFASITLWGFIGYQTTTLGLSGTIVPVGAPAHNYPVGGSAPSYVSREERGFLGATTNNKADYAIMAVPESGVVSYQSPPSLRDDVPAGEVKIIRSGKLSLVVKDVYQTAANIREIRAALGGQPGTESFSEYIKGAPSGSMTIWVPSEKFDIAMAEIEALAVRVNDRNVSTEDASMRFVDLEARLKNLRAAEAQIQEILKRSGKVSEILEVTQELTKTRGEIEQVQGELNYLSRKVALSSISIGLIQEVSPLEVRDEWEPSLVAKTATKNMLQELTEIVNWTIKFFIWLPVIIIKLLYACVLLLVLIIGWRLAKIVYRKLAAALPDLTSKV